MLSESSERNSETPPQKNPASEHNAPLPTSNPLNTLTPPTTGSVEPSYNGTPLQQILNNESTRHRIFDEVCQYNFPRQWKPSDIKEFADKTLPFTGSDSTGTLAWEAMLTTVEYAVDKRDSNLSKHLLTEIGKTQVPDFIVVACAEIFCRLDSTGLTHTPELKPWIQLFHAQGTDKVYETIHDELTSRLYRGELSCYEHLVSALCTSKSHIGLELIQNIIKPLLPTQKDTPLPTSPSREPKSLMGEVVKTGVGLALIGMVMETLSTGAELTPPPEQLRLVFAGISAGVMFYRIRRLRQSQTEQGATHRSPPPYSHMTFAEKVLRTLPYGHNQPQKIQETRKKLDLFLQTVHQNQREQSNQ